jgi:hypothetical protein
MNPSLRQRRARWLVFRLSADAGALLLSGAGARHRRVVGMADHLLLGGVVLGVGLREPSRLFCRLPLIQCAYLAQYLDICSVSCLLI